MQAGTLDDRIHIQRKTGSKDEWNTALPEAWENISTDRIAADVKHLSGLATIKADAAVSIVRASIRIRRRRDVAGGMRVLFDGRVYDIDSVLPGPAREYVDLICKLTQGPTP